jgi:hypothetical protein
VGLGLSTVYLEARFAVRCMIVRPVAPGSEARFIRRTA